MEVLNSIEQLEAHYGNKPPKAGALFKEIDHINEHYQQFIEASPFIILATEGKKGIDCSPRGDPAGFVKVQDPNTLLIPDRRGNNRLDSLKNIIENPNVGLIFLIPNAGETIRVSGQAKICVNPDLCQSMAMNGKAASSVIIVDVEKAYFQCQKAIVRSKLWDNSSYISRDQLPTAGQMVKVFSKQNNQDLDAEAYDRNYPEHMKNTIY